MSMKHVKEAPIRYFYENIFHGEALTSLSSDEMKRNLPKALEKAGDVDAHGRVSCPGAGSAVAAFSVSGAH